ncbi:MAG: CHAT domain-containing protein [Cyanobacteria bacterium P01_B01_bin.77]
MVLISILLLNFASCFKSELSQTQLLMSELVTANQIENGYRYAIDFEGIDQPILIMSKQRGMDVVLVVKDSNGAEVASVNLEERVRGVESVIIFPSDDSNYSLELKPIMITNHGSIELVVKRLSRTTHADRLRIEAEMLLSQALRVSEAKKMSYWNERVEEVERAISIFRMLDLQERLTSALFIQTYLTYVYLEDWDRSEGLAREVEKRLEEDSQQLVRASILRLLAKILIETSEGVDLIEMEIRIRQAYDLLDTVIEVQGQAGAVADVAWSTNIWAIAKYTQGDLESAEQGLNTAQKLALDSNAMAYYRIIRNNYNRITGAKNNRKSIEDLKNELWEIPRESEPLSVRQLLITLGDRYMDHGFWSDAIQTFSSAAEIPSSPSENMQLNAKMARAYFESGNLTRASIYLSDFAVKGVISNEVSLIQSLIHIKSDIALANGEFFEALRILDAGLKRLVTPRDRSYTLTLKAKVYLAMGESDIASILADQALASLNNQYDQDWYLDTLLVSAESKLQTGNNFIEVSPLLDQVQDILADLYHPLVESRLEYLRSRLEFLKGNGTEALVHSANAVELVLEQRFATGSLELRNELLDKQSAVFEQHVELILATEGANTAPKLDSSRFAEHLILFVDRIRANNLSVQQADLHSSDSNSALKFQRDQISLLTHEISETNKSDSVVYRQVENKLESALRKYDLLDQRYVGSNEQSMLKQDLSKVQEKLPKGAVIISYWLRGNTPLVWVVSSNSIQMHPLGKVDEITHTAETLHKEMSTQGVNYTPTLRNLRRLVVPESVIDDFEFLYLIPDGALHYVPPAALYPGTSSIKVVPSIRSLIDETSVTPQTAKGIVLFGDPEYVESKMRSLPFSLVEIESIASMAKNDDKEVNVLSGVNATRRAFLANASRYDFVHVAAHGIFDLEKPLASGIAFTSSEDHGEAVNQSFLTLHDVRGLSLPRSPIVVLSACRTAFGRHPSMEGYAGFPNAFLAAGASAVLVSLWDVPDRATAVLMELFYANVIDSAMEPARALRFAQNTMRENPRWRHSVNWAGWILVSRS